MVNGPEEMVIEEGGWGYGKGKQKQDNRIKLSFVVASSLSTAHASRVVWSRF